MTLPLFMPDIDPVALQIGPVAIRWYALAYVTAIAFGWFYISRLLKSSSLWTKTQPPLTGEQLDDLIIWMIGGIIIGGRLGYVIAYDTATIWSNPLQIFKTWEGGMSFHGGFLGVVFAALYFGYRQDLSHKQMLNIGDLLACSAPIGLMLGRLANFVNGELWGRVTDVPWGIVFCNSYSLSSNQGCIAGYDPRHPSQLYEAALEGVFLFILLFIMSHRYKLFSRPGLLMGTFITGYGLFRILLETVREPDAQMPIMLGGHLTMGMILSLPMVIVGLAWVYNAFRVRPPETASN